MMIDKWFRKNKVDRSSIDDRVNELKKRGVPAHVAIIMDGNGRWAKRRALPRVAGHREGMNTIKRTTKIASALGVEAITLYAFSTENWKRPRKEVEFLMKLPKELLHTYLPELIEQNVRVEMIGHREGLPAHTLQSIDYAIEQTKQNDGLILNFAMNYGGRAELLEATKAVAKKVAAGDYSVDAIDESLFERELMTTHLPDPDLLIRTSGEVRLSNFLLWQLAYAEFIFTDVLWPDFTETHFLDAVEEFQRRDRRFGNVEGKAHI